MANAKTGVLANSISRGYLIGLYRFFGFGDSITVNGGGVINNASAPDPNVYTYCWHRYAQMASGGKAIWGGNFGAGGQTIEQLQSIYLPYLLAYAQPGDQVIVHMGTNNLGSITTTNLANYRAVVDAMRNAGLVVHLCTVTPSGNTRQFHILNTFVKALAAEKRLEVVDLHAAVIDPTTGLWQTALTRDGGTHPSEAGAKAMGLAAGATLAALPGTANVAQWLAKSNAGYGVSRTTQTGGPGNPIFLTDTGGSPPLPASGVWQITSGSYSGATAFSSTDVGRKLTITGSAAGDVTVKVNISSAVAGDQFVLSTWLAAAVKAVGGWWAIGVQDGAGVPLLDWGYANANHVTEDVARSLLQLQWTHSGTAGMAIYLAVSGIAGAALEIEQFTVLNVTGLTT